MTHTSITAALIAVILMSFTPDANAREVKREPVPKQIITKKVKKTPKLYRSPHVTPAPKKSIRVIIAETDKGAVWLKPTKIELRYRF